MGDVRPRFFKSYALVEELNWCHAVHMQVRAARSDDRMTVGCTPTKTMARAEATVPILILSHAARKSLRYFGLAKIAWTRVTCQVFAVIPDLTGDARPRFFESLL